MTAPPNPTPRLIKACRQEMLDRPPVWLMRQAGRYMPEYRAVREKLSFLELCKTPDAAVEVTMQPIRAFDMDAAIIFSDILIPPEAMGMTVVFGDGGPQFPQPLRTAADVDRLIVPDPVEKTGFVMEIIAQMRQELSSHPDKALVGFAGAPWTLATYMIEGGGSKHFAKIKGMMYESPEVLHRLLGKLTETVTLYLNAQIEAGAQAVQLFDTWGGILNAADYRRFILPYHQQIIRNLNREGSQGTTPVILYVNNSRGLLPLMAEAEADVISIDPLTSISEARQLVGNRFGLQGNLDPIALFSKPEVLKPMVQSLIAEGGNQGYIFNLGHGILPPTPVENVRLLVDLVKESVLTPAHP